MWWPEIADDVLDLRVIEEPELAEPELQEVSADEVMLDDDPSLDESE